MTDPDRIETRSLAEEYLAGVEVKHDQDTADEIARQEMAGEENRKRLPHITRNGKRVRPPKPPKTRSATAQGNVRKFSDGSEMLATGNGWRKIATVKPKYKHGVRVE